MKRVKLSAAAAALAGFWFAASPNTAGAVPAVLTGDPVDGSGNPYSILPFVPLAHPGPDEKWSTGDEVIAPGIIGDVDLVLRTGGTYVAGSGVIPTGAASVAAAPAVTVGGTGLPAGGTEAAFQLIVSDGAAVPATGAPLTAADMNGRGALVLGYADLDGDGFLGPTSADAAGSSDNAVEEQEAFTPIAHRLGVITAGLASGSLAVSSALPASTGGLGIVVVAGASTGAASPLFLDGAWISTLLPCVWPADPTRVVGENPATPAPQSLVDLEFSLEDFYCPPAGDPVFGSALAIPLDGSSVTTDLLRSVSGPTTSVGLGVPVAAAGFVAEPLRRLTPVVASGGARQVVEGASAVALGDDGPGGVQATIVGFPADALGNQSDVALGGADLSFAVSSNLRIVSPDTDSNPQTETVTMAATGLTTLVLDDAGVSGDGGTTGQLVASLDGAVANVLRVNLGPPPSTTALGASSLVVRRSSKEAQDRLTVKATLTLDAALAPFAERDLTLTVSEGDKTLYSRLLPAGSLTSNAAGTTARYREARGVTSARLASLRLRSSGTTNATLLQASVRGLDLSALKSGDDEVELEIRIGSASHSGSLTCDTSGSETTKSCAR